MLLRQRLQGRAERGGIPLSDEELTRLENYLLLLQSWNRTMNLTALPIERFSEHALDRLVIEPLMAAELVENARLVWFDLGSGAGSPAIPLKIVRPLPVLTMVEARSRKAAFLREAVRTVGLSSTSVITSRFEQLPESASGTADLVSARAVKTDRMFMATAARLIREGGQLLLFQASSSSAPTPNGFRLVRERPLGPQGGVLRVFERQPAA